MDAPLSNCHSTDRSLGGRRLSAKAVVASVSCVGVAFAAVVAGDVVAEVILMVVAEPVLPSSFPLDCQWSIVHEDQTL